MATASDGWVTLETIAIECLDGSGNLSNVTSVAPRNDIQTIALASKPSGSSFPLTFDDQTTAGIPWSAVPPAGYFLWILTGITSGHAQRAALTWPENVGSLLAGCTLYIEVFDGMVVEGEAIYAGSMSQRVAPSDFADGTYPDAVTQFWDVIGGSPSATLASTTGTLLFRISASAGDTCFVDAIQLKDTTTGTTRIFDDQDGSLTYHGPGAIASTGLNGPGNYASLNGTATQMTGTGPGPLYVATGGASAIQSALLALSSVQALGLAVTGTGPYAVDFGGPMGGVLQPLITSSDGAITVAHTNPGGNVPSFIKNGGSPVPITLQPIWTTQVPFVVFNFPQAGAAFQYSRAGDNQHFSQSGFNAIQPGSSLSGRPFEATGGSVGAFVSFTFDRLTQGNTYQLAVTWQADDTLGIANWAVYDKSPSGTSTVQYRESPSSSLFVTIGAVSRDSTDGTPVTYAGTSVAVPANAVTYLWLDDSAALHQGANWPVSGGFVPLGWAIAGPTTLGQCVNVLSTTAVDLAVAPSDFTDGGFGYKNLPPATIAEGDTNTALAAVLLSPGSTGTILADAARLARTSEDTSTTFGRGDVVQLVIPDGYVSCIAGPISGQTITLSNVVGGSILGDFADVAKTMEVGYNVQGEAGICAFYSNLAHRIVTPMGALVNGNVVASDANGYPTSIHNSPLRGVRVVSIFEDEGGLGNGLAGAPPGVYTLLWDWDGTNAADDARLEAVVNGVVTEVGSYHTYTGTTDNIRVYHCTGSAIQFTPDLALSIIPFGSPDGSGNSVSSFRNLRIYPPDPSDATGMTPWGITQSGETWIASPTPPPLFHPNNALYTGPTTIARWMDETGTNGSSVCDFSDYGGESRLTRTPNSRFTTTNIVSITNVPDDVDIHFCIRDFSTSLVTTDAPHGAYNYAGFVQFLGGGTATFSDGSHITFNGFIPNVVWVVDETRFLIHYSPPFAGVTMTVPVGAGGTVSVYRGSTIPLSEMVAYCNTFGMSPYINTPVAETDACTTAVWDYLAANSTLPARSECGNEVWNNQIKDSYSMRDVSFQYQLAHGGTAWSPDNTGGVTDESYQPGFVDFNIRKWAIARARFVAGGRLATDVVRVMGVDSGDPGGAGNSVLLYSQQQGAEFEVVSGSCYFDNIYPGDVGNFAYLNDTMTVGQAIDQYELIALQGFVFGIITTQYNALLAHYGYSGVKLSNYEGSLQILAPGDSSAQGATIATQIGRHPRIFRVELARLQAMQDGNTAFSLAYYMNGAPQPGNGWSQFYGWNQAGGTGNVDVDTANVDNPFDMPNVLSEAGGAQHLWASLVGSGPPPPGPATPRRLRNGQLTTVGFPRGACQQTR